MSLYRRTETDEGARILAEARKLKRLPEYAHLSDGELIRLAYWGATGVDDKAEYLKSTGQE